MHNIVLLGNGGHCKVIKDIISRIDHMKLVAILDGAIQDRYEEDGIIYDDMDCIHNYIEHRFLIAIGNNKVRASIIEKYNLSNSQFINIIDPSAVISSSVSIGTGTVVMPNVVINADAKIGNHAIINSGAIIEHDNKISDFVHLSPNATLSGTVEVGKGTHIGTNSTVIPNISIGSNCTIGAGSVIIRNIPNNVVAVGNPARIIKNI